MDQDTANVAERIKKSIHGSVWLTPLNLADEREKFLGHHRHDPQFIYPDFDKSLLQENLNLLNSLTVPNVASLQDWILKRKMEFTKLEISLFLELNSNLITSNSCHLYQCTFDSRFIEKAKQDSASELPFVGSEDKTPQQIIEGIKSYLATYDISDWNVSLSDATDFYFRVKPNQKKILIGKKFNWDFCDFDNMLAHEIDGHVIRAVNASNQQESLLQIPLPFYIKTEEGLASFLGDYCSTTAEISRKHHALKYLAGDLARTASFKEVFDFLVEHGFTQELAFQRTFRLKRGISDTSMPGLFAKEAMYYEGMLEVKEYLDQGNSVEKLYAGKVGLEDLSFLEQPKRVIVPARVKKYLAK